jgi:hypothetical protein
VIGRQVKSQTVVELTAIFDLNRKFVFEKSNFFGFTTTAIGAPLHPSKY